MRRFALWVSTLSWLTLVGCGGDSTTGHPVTLRTEVTAEQGAAEEIVTAMGWSVRLSKAELSLGALYYFDGEPAFVRRHARPTWQRIALAPFLSVARAHPGHYVAGMALGQMTTPSFVDVLAGPARLPDATGITGTYQSARVVLAAPSSEPALSRLGTKVARVEGVARKGEQTVHFVLSADFGDVSRSVSRGQVDGCVFDASDVESDGAVTLRVRPHVWLDLVDFGGVAPGSVAMPTEVAPGELAQVAFALGVVQLSAYQFQYVP